MQTQSHSLKECLDCWAGVRRWVHALSRHRGFKHLISWLPLFFLGCSLLHNVLGAATKTLVFPQLADGGGIRSEIILTNASGHRATGTLFLKQSDGNTLAISLDGQLESIIPYAIPAGGELRMVSDAIGEAKAGYATVVPDEGSPAVSGSIVYNLNGFEVSVPSSPLASQFHLFVERTSLLNSGIAIANPGDKAIIVTLELLDERGQPLANTSVDLQSGEQLPRFITDEEIFNDDVPLNFIGSIRATSADSFSMVGLRQKVSGSLAILSGTSSSEGTSGLVFSQLADGGGIRFEILLLNSGQQLDAGTLFFRRPDGQPLELVIDSVTRTSVAYSIPAGGGFKIESDGAGGAKNGYALVESDLGDGSRLGGNIIYTLEGSEISVPTSPLSDAYHVFVEKDDSANTGIAVVNPGPATVDMVALLTGREGQFINARSMSLAAGEQRARLLDELFPEVGSDFSGTLQLRAQQGEFSLLGLRQRPDLSLSALSGSNTALPSAKLDLPPAGDFWFIVDLPDLTTEEQKELCALPPNELEDFRKQEGQAARKISDDLESYIRSWLRGEVSAEIPAGLLPDSIDNAKTHSWKLLPPEEVRAEDQWFIMPARGEPSADGFRELYQNNAATNITYLRLIFMAPFDSQLLVEGDFSHSRLMSFHILEPFDPEFPVTTNMGVMEVPLVDVDIQPDPGHVNPFVVGADRSATQRHYHVTFDLKEGNAFDLNPVLQDKHFRAPGNPDEPDPWERNVRVGGPLAASGSFGGGVIIPSLLWLRYYGPDLNPDGSVDPLAGVALPKALLRLDTGETFWLQPDFSLAAERQRTTGSGFTTFPSPPTELVGPGLGWFKMFSILLFIAEGRGYQMAEPFGELPAEGVKQAIRDQIACFYNQGSDLPPPGNIGHSATDEPYNNYLSRPFWMGLGSVYAITGKLPTTPPTRKGEPTMEAAEARFWSICHSVDLPDDPAPLNGLVYGCLMDDQITTNEERQYIIVWSRPEDRPSNAREECGVTWQDFGPQSVQRAGLRWQSVFPDHSMEEFSPSDENIPWERGSWSAESYDQSLVGRNQPGILGPFHPIIHYLKAREFESLGCPVDPGAVPEWVSK
ncbi:MAG: hypothetical protein ACE5JX_07815 [Acidobacteriota bacterium]